MGEKFMKIENFIEVLESLKKKGHNYIYFTNVFSGSVSAPSRKYNHYRLSYGVNKGIFLKDKEDKMLGQLSGFDEKSSVMNLCLILPKNKDIRPDLLKEK